MIAFLLAVSIDLSSFASPSYRAIEQVADLPESLQNAVAKLVEEPIAERGKPWNATDVVSPGESLPLRRFMLAAVSKSRALVVYEHGGIARHQHLLAFDLPPGKFPKLAGSAFIGAPATVDDLKKMLARPLTAADHY